MLNHACILSAGCSHLKLKKISVVARYQYYGQLKKTPWLHESLNFTFTFHYFILEFRNMHT